MGWSAKHERANAGMAVCFLFEKDAMHAANVAARDRFPSKSYVAESHKVPTHVMHHARRFILSLIT